MNIIRHNQSASVSGKITLPPIGSINKEFNTECLPNVSSVNNVTPSTNVANVNGVGGGVMVTQQASLMSSRGSNSKSLIYRSIPPKPHTFTLSDMIEPNFGGHGKKLGLTGSTASEFAKRFMSRPTTQPKVVDFKVSKMSAQKRRRGINGFFPPVKLRGSAKAHEKSTPIPVSEPTPNSSERNPLQLIPTSYSEVRPKSATRSISRSSRHSTRSVRKTPESVRTAPPQENGVVYPETFDFDDISLLPRPKKILPRRDLPWVFRYKVKRNMNEITKILASKPGTVVDA